MRWTKKLLAWLVAFEQLEGIWRKSFLVVIFQFFFRSEARCKGCQEPVTVAYTVERCAAFSNQRRMYLSSSYLRSKWKRSQKIPKSLDSQLAGLVVFGEEASYQHATVNAEVTKTETENDVSWFRELLIIGIRWYVKGEVVLWNGKQHCYEVWAKTFTSISIRTVFDEISTFAGNEWTDLHLWEKSSHITIW